MTKRFTGWHMTTILVAFFGVVIAVNIIMARYALSTFGGVTVENSYVASQEFNRWLDEAEREKALGWSAAVGRQSDGRIEIALVGPQPGAKVTVDARHPLGRQPDRMLVFAGVGDGRYLSRETLPEGRWTLRLAVEQGSHVWRKEIALQ
ncbi:MAG: FixH family protein [Novosphingobium sp.]|nr:FixH family protein [Novosphingobium sp.]